MKQVIGIIVSIIFIGSILLISKLLEKHNKEISRKFVHILLSNWWIIAILFFEDPIFAAIMPAIFVVINALSIKFNLMKSIEREQNDGFGTVYYAISLLILAIITFGKFHAPLIGLCAILVMGYGDGFAAIVGKNIKSPSYKIGKNTKKTLLGSLTMFVISFVIIAVFLAFNGTIYWIVKSLSIALAATVLEAIAIKGTDNIIVPLSVAGLLYVLI